MANTKELEDTLPLAAPNEPHHLRNTLNKKFAIYTSTSLEDAELQQLERDINGAGDSTSNSQLADRAVFESLRDIYDYHLEYRDRNQAVHPLYYIVADSKEWRSQGVLGVYLAAMSPKRNNVVGVCRCGVDAADMMGANLNIGNMDWMDFKETEADDWGVGNPYENPRYTDEPQRVPQRPNDRVFGWYSLVQKAVPINNMLEPGWSTLQQGESRFQSLGNLHTIDDPWVRIRRRHLFECLRRERLHRQLMAVAQKEDADSEEGFSICKLEWDGDLSGYSYDESSHAGQTQDLQRVQSIMPELSIVKKVRASQVLEELHALAEGL